MDFTREPIIETIITPKEGYRLVVRSSKGLGQEEHFVEAIEVVSFGQAFFFRSKERPKPFIVPVADYEILEVREPRMMLKTQTPEGSVKIAGGRDASYKAAREDSQGRGAPRPMPRTIPTPAAREEDEESLQPRAQAPEGRADQRGEPKGDRRRERRRGFRRRGRNGQPMTREEGAADEISEGAAPREDVSHADMIDEAAYEREEIEKAQSLADQIGSTSMPRAVLPPPTTLIRDNLQHLREHEAYKGAFYVREEQEQNSGDDEPALEGSKPSEIEKKESSLEEESFLFSTKVDAENQQDSRTES